ncbi:MAG: hypothetical protein KDB14_31540 [Planctomycetales bacterium]|nr:hypothetical protein [Planctomycetales bacterium]
MIARATAWGAALLFAGCGHSDPLAANAGRTGPSHNQPRVATGESDWFDHEVATPDTSLQRAAPSGDDWATEGASRGAKRDPMLDPASGANLSRSGAEPTGSTMLPPRSGSAEAPRIGDATAPAVERQTTRTEPAPAPEDAATILAKVRRRYAEATNYRDSGELLERRGDSLARHSFRHALSRASGEFLFLLKSARRSYAIQRDAAGQTWVGDSDATEPEPRDSLESALSVARRMSKSTSIIVPHLLLPEELSESPFWKAATELSRVADQAIDGAPCACLSARYHEHGQLRIWIDHDYGIRQLQLDEPRLNRHTRWRFESRFEQPLAPSELQP